MVVLQPNIRNKKNRQIASSRQFPAERLPNAQATRCNACGKSDGLPFSGIRAVPNLTKKLRGSSRIARRIKHRNGAEVISRRSNFDSMLLISGGSIGSHTLSENDGQKVFSVKPYIARIAHDSNT